MAGGGLNSVAFLACPRPCECQKTIGVGARNPGSEFSWRQRNTFAKPFAIPNLGVCPCIVYKSVLID